MSSILSGLFQKMYFNETQFQAKNKNISFQGNFRSKLNILQDKFIKKSKTFSRNPRKQILTINVALPYLDYQSDIVKKKNYQIVAVKKN